MCRKPASSAVCTACVTAALSGSSQSPFQLPSPRQGIFTPLESVYPSLRFIIFIALLSHVCAIASFIIIVPLCKLLQLFHIRQLQQSRKMLQQRPRSIPRIAIKSLCGRPDARRRYAFLQPARERYRPGRTAALYLLTVYQTSERFHTTNFKRKFQFSFLLRNTD